MEKIKVWKKIEEKINVYKGEISIIGGVFNTITKALEKWGGTHKLPKAAMDFNERINRNGLIDIATSRDSYTRNNRRKGFSFIAEK